MTNRKLAIVSRLLEELPNGATYGVDQAMTTWWVNLRKDGGMRLTHVGYTLFRTIMGLESWVVELPDQKPLLTKQIVLDLDKKLEWPYYIDGKNHKIIFFGSREAMMATMYGDIKQWLDSCTTATR